MWKASSFEKTLMLGKIEVRRRRGQKRMKGLNVITDSMDRSLSTVRETVKVREAQHVAVHGSQSWIQFSDWTTTQASEIITLWFIVHAWTPLRTCHHIPRLNAVCCNETVSLSMSTVSLYTHLHPRFLSYQYQGLSPFFLTKFSLSLSPGLFHPTSSYFKFTHLGILIRNMIKSTVDV